jgi:hypothetical protein
MVYRYNRVMKLSKIASVASFLNEGHYHAIILIRVIFSFISE